MKRRETRREMKQEVVGDKEGNPEKGELGADVSGT